MATRHARQATFTYPDLARLLGTALIATGVGLLVFVTITVTWGDPFTALATQAKQEQLEREFALVAPDDEDLTNATLDPELTRRAAAKAKRETKLGAPAGSLSIPRIGLKSIVVHGARDGTPDLTKGPGLYQGFQFPGSGVPIAIAGHRTTYGAPFMDIDELRPGDKIIVTMRYGRFTYTVQRTAIISPSDWSILDYGAAERTPAGRRKVAATGRCNQTCEHVVLTACHPKYSAARRIAVLARLSHVKLRA